MSLFGLWSIRRSFVAAEMCSSGLLWTSFVPLTTILDVSMEETQNVIEER